MQQQQHHIPNAASLRGSFNSGGDDATTRSRSSSSSSSRAHKVENTWGIWLKGLLGEISDLFTSCSADDLSCTADFSSNVEDDSIMNKCTICSKDGVPAANSFRCHAGEHIACAGCFQIIIERQSSSACVQNFIKTEKRIVCPSCLPEERISSMVSIKGNWKFRRSDIYKCGNVKTIKAYDDAIANADMEVQARKIEEEKERLRREKQELGSSLQFHRGKIADDILNTKCPNPTCETPFLNWTGCFCVTCKQDDQSIKTNYKYCGTKFCGWCLEICPTNITDHVKNCKNSRNPGNIFAKSDVLEVISKDFNLAHAERRKEKIKQYFADKKISQLDQNKLLQLMKKDFEDLCITFP